jgi:hypothetical protein
LGAALGFAAAEAGITAATPKRDELMKWHDDVAEAANKLLAKLDLPPGLSGDPMVYIPDFSTGWIAWLARGASGDKLGRLDGLITSSPLWSLYLGRRRPSANGNWRRKQVRALASQALRAIPAHIGLLSELARAARLEAELQHRDPPHGNVDVFRQVLFVRLRRVFTFAFGVCPGVFKDGQREAPAIEWHMAVLKHAAERRRQVADDAEVAALDRLATLTWETTGTYMQEAAARDRNARKIDAR